jgi:histidinol-phosphatase (PHP family)
MNPGPRILELVRSRDIPIVLGADAHRPERVADGYAVALRLLKSLGFSEVSYFLDRKRHTVAIGTALASLR